MVFRLTSWGTVDQGSLQEGCVNLVHTSSPRVGGNWDVQLDPAAGPELAEGVNGDCRTAGTCQAERKQKNVFITTSDSLILKADEYGISSSTSWSFQVLPQYLYRIQVDTLIIPILNFYLAYFQPFRHRKRLCNPFRTAIPQLYPQLFWKMS